MEITQVQIFCKSIGANLPYLQWSDPGLTEALPGGSEDEAMVHAQLAVAHHVAHGAVMGVPCRPLLENCCDTPNPTHRSGRVLRK